MNRVTLTSLRTGLRGTLAYGSPGGTMIIDAVLNVTLNLVGRGMSIQQAISAPRWSATGGAGSISCVGAAAFLQPRFSVTTQDALRTLGHTGLGNVGPMAALWRSVLSRGSSSTSRPAAGLVAPTRAARAR